MGTLYIDRKDVELRQSGRRLEIYEQGRLAGALPIPHLERVVIYSRTRLDTGVLGAFAEHGVGVTVLSPRHAARTGVFVGRPHNDVTRRLAQYRFYLDQSWRDRWAAKLVSRKLRSQHRLLSSALAQRPDRRHGLSRALRALEERLAALEAGPTVTRTRGLEGAAAAAYFQGYTSLFAASLDFTGRNRRPPRDPVNACLSLGYTLLHAEAVMASHAAGLDPLLGFYHEPAYGRESLASDLIEPLRPRVDEWVWGLFRDRTLRAEDFAQDKGACLLNKAGRQTFYRAYEAPAGHMRRHLRRYAVTLGLALVRDAGDPLDLPAEALGT